MEAVLFIPPYRCRIFTYCVETRKERLGKARSKEVCPVEGGEGNPVTVDVVRVSVWSVCIQEAAPESRLQHSCEERSTPYNLVTLERAEARGRIFRIVSNTTIERCEAY